MHTGQLRLYAEKASTRREWENLRREESDINEDSTEGKSALGKTARKKNYLEQDPIWSNILFGTRFYLEQEFSPAKGST